MTKTLGGALLTLAFGASTLADTRPPMGPVAAECEHVAQTLRQLERDWADAEGAGDSARIARILADDWTGVGNDGSKLTKEQLIARIKSRKVRTPSVELGPMEVKVLGEVAVVQGRDLERSAANGDLVWMDVFTRRDGQWVAVRSQSARALTPSRRRWSV
jgi:ketosteroid isomerase-like protein